MRFGRELGGEGQVAREADERSAANADVPIFMGHGRSDGIVPMALGTTSRDALRALGHDVEWHEYPMAHAVCPDEIEDIRNWLLRVLPGGRR